MKNIAIVIGLFVLFFSCDPGTTNEQEVFGSAELKSNANKVILCHNSHTISIGNNALQAHLDHGDTLGECLSKTYVPDDTFEQNLIYLGLDNVMDDYVLTDNISNITELTLYNMENILGVGYGVFISDFTGIEDFSSMEVFILQGLEGGITSDNIDLSKNPLLKVITLNCAGFSGVDLSNNLALEQFSIADSGNAQTCGAILKGLDFSSNLNLKKLSIWTRDTSYDEINSALGTAPTLETISIGYVGVGTINLQSNTNLIDLYISTSGRIISSLIIDLRNGANNKLQTLEIHAELEINDVCIQVENPEYVESIVSASNNDGPTTGINVTTNCN